MDKIMRICKGCLISLIAFGILTLLGALLLWLTPFPESWSFFYLIGAMALASLFMGLYTGSYFERAGILWGFLSSVILLVLILLACSACFSSFLNLNMVTPLYLVPVGLGTLGGIMGANMKK